MKSILPLFSFLLAFLLANPLSAQIQDGFDDRDDFETVFSSKVRVRPVLSIHNDFTVFQGGPIATAGLGLGAVFNRKFFLGTFISGVPGTPSFESNDDIYNLTLNYGGLWTAYHIQPQKAVHLSLDLKYGVGALEMRRNRSNYSPIYNIMVTIPSVNVEMNMSKWCKATIGIGHKYFSGGHNPYMEVTDLNGIAVNSSLKFGWFK